MIKQTNKITGKLNASVIHVYPELENVEITPAVEDKTYTPTKYGFEEVKVKGVQAYIDEDIKPEYIKDGVDILGVIGNVVELQGEEKTIVPSISQQVILPSEDKNGMTKITVEAVDNTIDEDIKPENIVDGVEILGVVGNYKGIDTSDATVTPDKVLAGTTVYINNEKIEGTLPNNGELEFIPSDELQIVPEGYTSGGIVSAADITALNEYNACLTLANSIDNLGDYTDTTATAEDIRDGKTAYSNGERIVGTMEVSNHNTTLSVEGITNFRIIQTIKEIDFVGIDTSKITNFNSAFNGCKNLVRINGEIDCSKVTNIGSMFYGCTLLKEFNIKNTNSVTDMSGMYHNCSSLVDIPMLNTKSLVNNQYDGPLQNTFYNCTSLSDESLNNVLAMCTNATNITYNKTLKYVGLTQAQATKCQSLSNWQAFVDAGWKTGY